MLGPTTKEKEGKKEKERWMRSDETFTSRSITNSANR
jgi:hypothetical protein